MKLNRSKTTFGRHETFPLRYGWLSKGFAALCARPPLFSQPDQAMVTLGVGRNMVHAIEYWLRATGLIELDGSGAAQPTALGEILLGADGDPYLEDETTLWLIHWLIASSTEQATGFYWFFNHFALPRFQEQDALNALNAFVERELRMRRAQTTLKSDLSTLLRMYAPLAGRTDEHLDSPLAQLRLIEVTAGREYRSPRLSRPFLPPMALHFALAQRFAADRAQAALPIRALLYGGDDWAAPGPVFRLNEDGLMQALGQVMEHYPDCYALRESAGVHQLYWQGGIRDPLDLLRDHYRSITA